MGFKIFEKKKIRIYRSTLTLDRSPETYETWWIGSLGEDAGDLQLVDEGREDGVGGCKQTNKNASVKSVKEISFDHQMTQILLSIQLTQQE
jgi:hypothetical protein